MRVALKDSLVDSSRILLEQAYYICTLDFQEKCCFVRINCLANKLIAVRVKRCKAMYFSSFDREIVNR